MTDLNRVASLYDHLGISYEISERKNGYDLVVGRKSGTDIKFDTNKLFTDSYSYTEYTFDKDYKFISQYIGEQ